MQKNTKSKHWRKMKALPPASLSSCLLISIHPAKVGMFRFLLEAYEHLAYFTVINKRKAILKIIFSPHQERSVKMALADIGQSIEFTFLPWPSSVVTHISCI